MSEKLTGLLKKVEGGEVSRTAFILAMDGGANRAYRACSGSLDAAKALHEALLPGWYKTIWGSPRMNAATVSIVSEDGVRKQFHGRDKSPARAWLIAILKARIASQPQERVEA